MAAGVTIKLKRKAGAFSNGELAAGELGLDVSNSKLYASINGTTVFLIDTVGLTDIVNDGSPQLGANLDAQSYKITSLGAPTAGGDAVNKTYVDAAIQGLTWEEPVLAIQTDNTLDPGATPTEGDRYILTDVGALHANFGTITGVGNNDIVQYVTSAFVIKYDASVIGEGGAVYSDANNQTYVFNGSAWVAMGGVADHGALTGLSDDDHTQYAIISSQSAAPSSTPARIGAANVKTDATKTVYIAVGSSSSADWLELLSINSTVTSSGLTIDGGTI